jgi:hypothetical protein
MAFPTNPTNGQQATNNGVVYTYDSTLTAWTVGTNPGGNISGNVLNITSAATIGTTLAVTGATTLSSTLGVTGNISGANILTGGLISATGNVNVGNLINAGLTSVTGNISGGNLTTGGLISSTGTVTGGNLITGGTLSVTGLTTLAANLTVTGHAFPSANATYDLGSTTARWRNIYTNDLQLNNGIGDYTIVEGEDDLFLYNNKKGKVYKFALIETDPTTAPPKAKTD